MRPSVQKTVLLALGAAFLSSALGMSSGTTGASDKAPSVRIVVLPGDKGATRLGETGFDRLLRQAQRERVVKRLVLSETAPGAMMGEAAPFQRADLIERVRHRLRIEAGGELR
jgi:hypothetical protein